MNEKLYSAIKQNEEKGDFTHTIINEEKIKEAEEKLNLELPTQYKNFLESFGHGGIGGLEILGIGNNKLIFVETTLRYREYGLSLNLITIENCDEWLYCVDVNDGKIVMWANGCKEISVAYNNFDEYLEDRIKDVLENM
ncbi:MAG: SMI1/KNR4 family protein [Breznakia sp.]